MTLILALSVSELSKCGYFALAERCSSIELISAIIDTRNIGFG